ncbi:hypothetical protein QBC34DRAFT_429855 [Podospora aff. communis PSN243]|uniref:Uncharacterized protein n=1 Tax=Podospora aff. communis PSN243 TaxID=3040156 RepID=A0AAV9G8U2_9PEZI|nr:hypothetical protein QBC34DRAFT_429855 [Podospora aff. communis PSN243]
MALSRSLLSAVLALVPVQESRHAGLVGRDIECCPCSESTPTVTVTFEAPPSTSVKTVTVTPSANPPSPAVTVTVTEPGPSVPPPQIQTVTVTYPGRGWPGKPHFPPTVTVTLPGEATGVTKYETIYISESTTIRPPTVPLTKTLSPSTITSISTATASRPPQEKHNKPTPPKPVTITASTPDTPQKPATVTATITKPQKPSPKPTHPSPPDWPHPSGPPFGPHPKPEDWPWDWDNCHNNDDEDCAHPKPPSPHVKPTPSEALTTAKHLTRTSTVLSSRIRTATAFVTATAHGEDCVSMSTTRVTVFNTITATIHPTAGVRTPPVRRSVHEWV